MTSPSYFLVIVIMYIISIKKLTFITMAPVYKNGGGGSRLYKSFPLTYNPFFSKFISTDSRNPYSFCLIYSWVLLLFNFLWGNFPTSWSLSPVLGFLPHSQDAVEYQRKVPLIVLRRYVWPMSCASTLVPSVHGLQASSSILIAITVV